MPKLNWCGQRRLTPQVASDSVLCPRQQAYSVSNVLLVTSGLKFCDKLKVLTVVLISMKISWNVTMCRLAIDTDVSEEPSVSISKPWAVQEES